MKNLGPSTIITGVLVLGLLILPVFLLDLGEAEQANELNRPSRTPAGVGMPQPAPNNLRGDNSGAAREGESPEPAGNEPPDSD